MAQVLKLKRTAVSGKIPTTSHIELGELAMNTFDGRIFLKKDSGTPIITEILTTNTEGSITGSLNLNGDITANNLTLSGNATIDGNITLGGNITIGDNVADVVTVTAGFSGSLIPETTSTYDLGSSTKKWNNLHVVTASADYFIGDGSGLTNVVAEVSQVATVVSTFTNQTSVTVTHNFGTKNIIVSVYDDNDSYFIPQSIVTTNDNQVTITFNSTESGRVVVAKGGHIIANEDLTSHREDVTGNSVYTITHNLDEEYPLVQAWNTTSKRQEVPSIIESVSANVFDIEFASIFSGRIIVKK
jgi:hypothetical protein